MIRRGHFLVSLVFCLFVFVLIEDGAVDILKEEIVLCRRMKFYD